MTNILVVDDEDKFREILLEFLKFNSRSTVYEASDGKEAYQLATSHNIDLFLVDLEMENMGGIEFIKMIRGLALYQKQPIVVITGYPDATNKEACKAAGATGFMVKPVDFKELGVVVKTLLENWDSSQDNNKETTSGVYNK